MVALYLLYLAPASRASTGGIDGVSNLHVAVILEKADTGTGSQLQHI